MPDRGLEARLAAVERAVTDGETDSGLADVADVATAVENVEERVGALESRVNELDAAVQAIRGYVGNVREVDEELERRADAALAKAEAVEQRVAAVEDRSDARAFDRPTAPTEPPVLDGDSESDESQRDDLLSRLCGQL